MKTTTEWATYTLTASRHGETRVCRFEDANDMEATFTAMFTILDRAGQRDKHDEPTSTAKIWALGRIELARDGEIIKVMEAKR